MNSDGKYPISIAPGRLSEVGLTPQGCRVYFFNGMGYWIAPSGIYLYCNEYSALDVKAPYSGGTTCSSWAPIPIKQTLLRVLKRQSERAGLYMTIRRRYNTVTMVEVGIKVLADNRSEVSVAIPSSLRYAYGNKPRVVIGTVPKGESTSWLELKAFIFKEKIVHEFNERFLVTVDQAMTFHKECPELTKEDVCA